MNRKKKKKAEKRVKINKRKTVAFIPQQCIFSYAQTFTIAVYLEQKNNTQWKSMYYRVNKRVRK